jgi:hypothetical protein
MLSSSPSHKSKSGPGDPDGGSLAYREGIDKEEILQREGRE